jgi:hypothetical protein
MRRHPGLAEGFSGGGRIEGPAHNVGAGDVEALALSAIDAARVELTKGLTLRQASTAVNDANPSLFLAAYNKNCLQGVRQLRTDCTM